MHVCFYINQMSIYMVEYGQVVLCFYISGKVSRSTCMFDAVEEIKLSY